MDAPTQTTPGFNFDNSYARELPGFYVEQSAAEFPAPKLVLLNTALAEELGLNAAALSGEDGAAIFSGQRIPEGAHPLAQAYAGHQFGGFSPQLGDGRALLLGEIVTPSGQRRDIQLKGSGRTPFSRGGDGKAALGPVLREYLIGEAMHALGIPTTRALAAVTTGETVMREGMPPGAVLTRIAASHLRVGTFEFFSARQDVEKLRKLADYAIARHDPALADAEDKYLKFFENVLDRQARLIAKWMHVGFIHGVMNTDNISISGETIDYGPCAFMDAYDPSTVFSSIDTGGRYAYGQQPNIAIWNLTRLAESLLGLFDDTDAAVEAMNERLGRFPPLFLDYWLEGMRAKIGLQTVEEGDGELANALLAAIMAERADYTLTFRALAAAARGDAAPLHAVLATPTALDGWMEGWMARLAREEGTLADRAAAMDAVNPLYVPRNHLVEAALVAASETGDLAPFERLLAVLSKPFEAREGFEEYTRPASDDFARRYQTFCGT